MCQFQFLLHSAIYVPFPVREEVRLVSTTAAWQIYSLQTAQKDKLGSFLTVKVCSPRDKARLCFALSA